LKSNEIAQAEVVKQKKFRAAVFVPIDSGSDTAGVIGVYASRPYAFSHLDIDIVSSVSQWLCTRLLQHTRVEEAMRMKTKIDLEMPLIEAGILAMERVHDARNKLYCAQSALSNITDRYHRLDKKPPDYVNAIEAGDHIEDADKIITALVKRSRLVDLNLKKHDLSLLIKEIVDSFSARAEEIKVRILYQPKEEIFIKADSWQFVRVLNNLFDNALHFLSKKQSGKRLIEIRTEVQENKVQIFFKDSGVGIPPHALPNIFDIFFTTKGEKGMGFGLAIARRIVEEHGGTISATSQWGEYTEFKIVLNIL
jgi:two-component system autoinducer 1 sensor kinase/phosphatase LuxN